ncbi:hypothetical protein [Iodobacter fluviatilis]|nr:hypothetical protein [Iodobacter fluviatilis]
MVLPSENFSHDVQKNADLLDRLKSKFTEQKGEMGAATSDKCLQIIKEVDTILVSGEFELGEKEYAELSLKFKELKKQFLKCGNQEVSKDLISLSRYLEVEMKAKWAELCCLKQQSHLERKYHEFDQPGIYKEKGGELVVGVGFGLEMAGVGGKVKGGVKGGFAHFMGSNDDGSVSVGERRTFGVSVGGIAGVGSLGVEGEVKGTHSREYNSSKHYALNKNICGSRKKSAGQSRAFLGLFEKNELDKYPDIIQAAINQKAAMPPLRDSTDFFCSSYPSRRALAPVGCTLPKGFRWTPSLQQEINRLTSPTILELSPSSPDSIIGKNSIAPPVEANSRTFKLAAKLGVEVSGFSVSMGGAVEETSTEVKVPVPLQNIIESQAKDLEQERLELVLESAYSAAYERFPAVRPIFRSWFFANKSVSEAELNNLTNVLEDQFNSFCLKVQKYDHAIDTACLSERKLIKDEYEAIWDSEFKTCREHVLADLCKLHALLLHQVVKCDSHEAVLARLKSMGAQLYSPPISFDKKVFSKQTSFTDILKVQKYSRIVELNLAAGMPVLGIKGKAMLTEARLSNPNMYRAGSYRDLTLTLTGTLLDAGGLNKIAEKLANQINLPGISADILIAELGKISGSLQCELEGGVKVMFRFFQPNYQKAQGFPDKAKGYQLQLTRVSTERSVKLAGAVSIPTPVAGLMIDIGGRLSNAASHVLLERWGENSLSAPMMHYTNLKAIDESSRWAALSNTCLYKKSPTGEDLFLKLASNLCNIESAVHHEVKFFLSSQDKSLGSEDHFSRDFFNNMLSFVKFDNQDNRKLAQECLEKLIERQFLLWQEERLKFTGRVRGMEIQ